MARVCHPDELNRVLDQRRIGMMEGAPFETETRILFKRTQYRWVLVQYNPLKNEQGEIIRWYAAATDIDDRKKAEDALRSSERNLSQMINAIPCWSDVFSSDGSVLYRNQTVSDYTGVPQEEVRKEDFRARVFHSEDWKGLEERRLALARPLPFEDEQRVLAKDGKYRWFLFRYKPLLDEQGRIERWYSAGFDIDDRKRAEAEVEQAYLRLAEAQRLSKTGSFITDLMADEHDWSEETFRIFGLDPAAKVTIEMVRNLVHPEDLPTFDAVIARGMTGMDVDFLFRIVTSGGALKHIRGMARILSQTHGRPLFIGALQDVTDAKVAEEALDRARSELAHVSRVNTLNALTGSIAHEINQPLSGIITNAGTCLRMLDSDPPNIEGARETVRRTLRDGNRAADVISRLRALFSKKEFSLEPLDLNEATREVIALSMSDLQRNRVTLRSELAADLPPVTGDRVQLQQVILNLVRNASDAMADIGERPRDLLIRTLRDGDGRVRLSVQDAGIGVGPQDLQKLFEAFYTTKNGGMGIGLSVSRSIIERHHGRLWAEANDGPGATFSFSVPCNP
jgi:PAS domain S-box-containing protein